VALFVCLDQDRNKCDEPAYGSMAYFLSLSLTSFYQNPIVYDWLQAPVDTA
jgi:hypothetical protein